MRLWASAIPLGMLLAWTCVVTAGETGTVPPAARVSDGDFERADLGFGVHDRAGVWVRRLHDAPEAAIELVAGAGRGGSRGVRYRREGARSSNIHLDQLVTVRPHTVYQVRAWVKGDGSLNPLLVVQTVQWRTLATVAVGPSEEWREATLLFDSYENERVRLEWFPGATGKLYTGAAGVSFLDDVSIVPLEPVPPAVRQTFDVQCSRAGEEIVPGRGPQAAVGKGAPCRPIHCRDGVLVYDDGSEVALWGVNFQTPLSWEWRGRLRPCGIPETAEALKLVTDRNLAQLPLMGVGVIRMHLLPSDFTNRDGELVDTVYLDVLDYVIFRCRSMGIYVYLTLMNEMHTQYVSDSFMVGRERQEWLFDDDFVARSERYFRALLGHRNRYNGTPYCTEPAIALVELINEPAYLDGVEVLQGARRRVYRQAFARWCRGQAVEGAPPALFASYRYEVVSAYLARMHAAIRAVGCDKPVAWNLNWPGMVAGHEDVFQAAADSPIEVVSFCCYPGQSDVKSPFWANPVDLSGNNYLPYLRSCYREYRRLRWALGRRFAGKAKVVYEFENMYNHSTSYVYPAMARLFRSLGAQVAPMWQYTLSPVAEFTGGSHYLNLYCTPAKAVAFRIAGEVFRHLPRYAAYDTEAESEMSFGACSLSFERGTSQWAADDAVMYSGPSADLPADFGDRVRTIVGVGSSPLVRYGGSGAYFLEFGDDTATVTILPDIEYVRPPWQRGSREEPRSRLCRLESDASHRFALRLPRGLEHAAVTRLDDPEAAVEASEADGWVSFPVHPGPYRVEFR